MMKNVLITGASRGIGRAIALKMAESGCNLFINSLCGNGTEKLEAVRDEIVRLRAGKGIPGETYLVPCDVGDPGAVRGMFERIENILRLQADPAAGRDCNDPAVRTEHDEPTAGTGCDDPAAGTDHVEPACPADSCGIDILINNAGISEIGLIQDMTDEEWNRIVSVNLSSVHYCSRAVIPYMLAAGEGRILNISSVWGIVGASCEVAYSATKGGVNAYTKALAKELAPSGIAVNAIACGCIDTDMNRHFDDAERAALCDEIPAGRFAQPEEVAKLAASICEQSTYLTGQVITFDGGWI